MKVNGLVKLLPTGTNSTFFTECCHVAITDDEQRCPRCKEMVVGYDSEPGNERHIARWNHAYRRMNAKGA